MGNLPSPIAESNSGRSETEDGASQKKSNSNHSEAEEGTSQKKSDRGSEQASRVESQVEGALGTKVKKERASSNGSTSQASKTVMEKRSEEERSDSEEDGSGLSEPKVGKLDKSDGVFSSDEGGPKSARSQNTSELRKMLKKEKRKIREPKSAGWEKNGEDQSRRTEGWRDVKKGTGVGVARGEGVRKPGH